MFEIIIIIHYYFTNLISQHRHNLLFFLKYLFNIVMYKFEHKTESTN